MRPESFPKQLERLKNKDPEFVNLELTSCRLRDDDIESLANAIVGNNIIKRIELAYNFITHIGVMHLVNALAENTSLEYLDLEDNSISDQGTKAISQLLQNPKCSIRYLDLKSNSITGVGFHYIADTLALTTTLDSICLSNNLFDQGSLSSFTEKLVSTKSLTKLYLDGVLNNGSGLSYIASGLQGNTSLRLLSLCSNGIKQSGLRSLATALEKNSTIQELNLTNNKISSEGCARLSKGIAANRSLTHLDLSDNVNLKGDSILPLTNALKAHTMIKRLHLRDVSIASGFKHILDMLAVNSSLDTLGIDCISIKSEDLINLFKVLESNLTLRNLYITYNTIFMHSAPALLYYLQHFSSLNVLHVTFASLNLGMITQIEAAVQSNRHIMYFNATKATEDNVTKGSAFIDDVKMDMLLEARRKDIAQRVTNCHLLDNILYLFDIQSAVHCISINQPTLAPTDAFHKFHLQCSKLSDFFAKHLSVYSSFSALPYDVVRYITRISCNDGLSSKAFEAVGLKYSETLLTKDTEKLMHK